MLKGKDKISSFAFLKISIFHFCIFTVIGTYYLIRENFIGEIFFIRENVPHLD